MIRSLLALFTGIVALAAPAAAAVPPARFTADQLVAALTRDLGSHYDFDGTLQLELTGPWTAPDAAASAWQVIVVEYPSVPGPTLFLRVRLVADGVAVDEFPLQLHAAVWRNTWFTREPLVNGGSLDPSMLEARRIDSLQQRDALPTNVGLGSFITVRQIPAGRALSWHDIALRPLVRRGEMINVVAEEGMLLVTLKAQALENGAQGDLVTVRNLQTLREITGRVVGEDCVAVTF